MPWRRLRDRQATQLRVTTAATAKDGRRIYTRKTSQPEALHRIIYDALKLPHQPVKTRYEN